MEVKDVSVTVDLLVKPVLNENLNHVLKHALMVVSVKLIQMDNNIAIAQQDGPVQIVQSVLSVISNARMVVNAFHTVEVNAVIVQLVGWVLFVNNAIASKIVDHMELVSEVEQAVLVNAETTTLVNTAISNHVQIIVTAEEIVSWEDVIATMVSLLNLLFV